MSAQELNRELRQARDELKRVREQIQSLQSHKRTLNAKIDNLERQLNSVPEPEVDHTEDQTYEWSDKVEELLKNVFKLKAFRSHQLAAINATLSGKDCIVIMPTGGGKSLCFQLPALVNDGISVVVSPLLSLMEDQLIGLQELNIETSIINGQTPVKKANEIMRSMADPKSPLKMVYVTPEKVAQSKKFMSQMEKCYNNGRLSRIVIDEVHCCSQWGHDFRKDYKFLGVMKTQFPETPILGLTATATSDVIKDIQKILSIEGCLVLKDSFFRPNLNYVIEKTNIKREEQIQRIAFLLKNKYYNQSGIIYCLTIKDVEDVTQKLQSLGVKAGAYHASLPASEKSMTHKDWSKNNLQVIVATVAFGMGINKLDVRFVIHISLSKALESYYQETGRAGRDGQPADCILYYWFNDVFRTTTLVYGSAANKDLGNVYAMVRYCLEEKECRKKQIAVYFGDKWDNKCDNKCDNCLNQRQLNEIDCTKYLNDLIEIIENSKENLTALKLVDAWCGKGNKNARLANVEPPNLPRDVCNSIIGLLLVDNYLEEKFHFTPYSTISYLKVGIESHIRDKDFKKIYSLNCHQIPALQSTPKPNSTSEFLSIRKTKVKNIKTNIRTESNIQKTKPKRVSLEIETIEDNEDMGSYSEDIEIKKKSKKMKIESDEDSNELICLD